MPERKHQRDKEAELDSGGIYPSLMEVKQRVSLRENLWYYFIQSLAGQISNKSM